MTSNAKAITIIINGWGMMFTIVPMDRRRGFLDDRNSVHAFLLTKDIEKMLPPSFFTEARMRAQHFVQARVLSWNGLLDVRVTRVFRGNLKRGDRLALLVSVAGDSPLRLGDSTLWASAKDVMSARYVEVFLDGDPPTMVCDQIKYLKRAFWWPSGDPTQEAFIW